METDITKQRVWNTKQLVTAIAVSISLTFATTMIWARFLYVETYVETVDNRYKKITDRNILRLEKIEDIINNDK